MRLEAHAHYPNRRRREPEVFCPTKTLYCRLRIRAPRRTNHH